MFGRCTILQTFLSVIILFDDRFAANVPTYHLGLNAEQICNAAASITREKARNIS